MAAIPLEPEPDAAAPEDVAALVRRGSEGEPGGRDALCAAAYEELRKPVRSRLHKQGRLTNLDTTALAHETDLRFQSGDPLRANAEVQTRHPCREHP